MTGGGRGSGRHTGPRRNVTSAPAPVQGRPATPRRKTLDDEWDEHMTGLLREAAEVREERDRARQSEDAILAERETAALLHAIQARGRPRVKHDAVRSSAGRPRGSAPVTA